MGVAVMGVYVYAPDAENYSTTGLIGDIQPVECVFEEQKNGLSKLTMKLMYDDIGKWRRVRNGCRIKCLVPSRVPPVVENGALASSVRTYTIGDVARAFLYFRDGSVYEEIPVRRTEEELRFYKIGEETTVGDSRMIPVFAKLPSGNNFVNCSGYMKLSELEYEGTEVIPAALNGLESLETPARLSWQLFTVTGIQETLESVTVNCEHVFYGLVANFTSWEPDAETNYTGAQACAGVMSHLYSADGCFTVRSNGASSVPGSRIDVARKNAVEAFLDPQGGICALYDMNILRNNFDLYLMDNVGTDRGFVVEYGKNMLGVQRDESIQNVVTRVFPFGHTSDGNLVWLTTAPIYEDSQYIDDYAAPICELFDTGLKIGENGVTEANIQTKLREEAQKRFTVDKADLPEVSMTISFISIGDTEEYRQYRGLDKVYLHDIISIKDDVRDYRYSAQVIGIQYNVLTDMLESVTIGTIANWNGKRKIARWQVPEISGENIRLKSLLAGAFGDGSITAEAIQNGAISTVHLASATIDDLTTDALNAAYANIHELIAGRIRAQDIEADAIQAQHIGAGVIEAGHISAEAVTSEKIHANAITSEKIDAGAITTAALAAQSVTADKIAAGAITSDKIYAGSITSDKISTNDLAAIQATLQIATIANAQIASADISFANVKDLNAQSAFFGQAVIQEGIANKLFIPRLSVVYAQIVSATIGDLVIQATDDNFYKLDVDQEGNVTATLVTPTAEEIEQGHTADGRTIYLGTDIVAEDLNTTNIYASHALMDDITANIINVDKLFAREATIAQINAMDLMSNTYIRSVVGDWTGESTITQTVNSISSKIGDLGYGTNYMQPDEPDHDHLNAGDTWIQTMSNGSWAEVYNDQTNYPTWQSIYDNVSTWQVLGSIPKMYVWDGQHFQLLYDAMMPTTVETEILQLQNEVLLRATKAEVNDLESQVAVFDARLTVQAEEIEAAVSAVNAKASSYITLSDPRTQYAITIGDIWVKHDPFFQSWQTVYDHYMTWQDLLDAHDSWAEGLGDTTYVWDGSSWVITSDRATEIQSRTLIEENSKSITLLAEADARFQGGLVSLEAKVQVTADRITQEVERATSAESDRIQKTIQYQTADDIVSEAVSQANTTANETYIAKTSAYQSAEAIKNEAVRVAGNNASATFIAKKQGYSSVDDIITQAESLAEDAATIAKNASIAKTSTYQTAEAIVNTAVAQARTNANNSYIKKTSSYQTADAIVSAAEEYVDGELTNYSTFTQTSDMIETYVTNNAYTIRSGVAINANGIVISGGKYIQIKSGSSFTVQSGNFSIDTSGNVSMTGSITATDGSIAGWTISSTTLKGNKVGLAKTSSDTATAIWAGNSSASSAPFRVTQAGKLYASGAVISGDSTFSGTMSADCITSGTMSANRISGGTLSLGGSGNANGVLQIKNASGTVIGKWDKDGITATGGTFSGTITGSTITGGSLNIGSGNFTVDSSGNVVLKSLQVATETGQITTVNLSSNTTAYPMWKLWYETIKASSITTESGYCKSFTLSNGTTVNFNNAASVTVDGSWSGNTFTARATNGAYIQTELSIGNGSPGGTATPLAMTFDSSHVGRGNVSARDSTGHGTAYPITFSVDASGVFSDGMTYANSLYRDWGSGRQLGYMDHGTFEPVGSSSTHWYSK